MGLLDEASFSAPDLANDSRFTHNGSIPEGTPIWTGTTNLNYDGTGDYSDLDSQIYTDGISKGSHAFTYQAASSGYFFNQNNGSGVFIANYNDANDRLWFHVQTSTGNYVDSICDNNFFVAGTDYFIVCTWDLGTQDLNIYSNKSGSMAEVTYLTGHENKVVGSPAGTISTGTNLRIGAWSGPSLYYSGEIEWPIAFDDRVLTGSEVSTLYAEVQAYPPAVADPTSGVSRTGIGLNSWFTGGRQKRRRRRR